MKFRDVGQSSMRVAFVVDELMLKEMQRRVVLRETGELGVGPVADQRIGNVPSW